MKTVDERFDEKWEAVTESGCWIWTGALFENEYGAFTIVHGRTIRAHRYSWERINGSIPKGLFACHRCDVPACVNHAHLFLGTNSDNQLDALKKGKLNPPLGEHHGFSKINESDVLRIRQMAAAGIFQDAIASAFKISQSNVSCIIQRKTWRHIP